MKTKNTTPLEQFQYLVDKSWKLEATWISLEHIYIYYLWNEHVQDQIINSKIKDFSLRLNILLILNLETRGTH